MELWVKLDTDGTSQYVMQAMANDQFKVGDHIRVVRKQGEVKVEADNTAK